MSKRTKKHDKVVDAVISSAIILAWVAPLTYAALSYAL